MDALHSAQEGMRTFDEKTAGQDVPSIELLSASSLSEQVAELEKIAFKSKGCRCGEIKATLLVNYGPNGRHISGLVTDSMDQMEMMLMVLRHYIAANAEIKVEKGQNDEP